MLKYIRDIFNEPSHIKLHSHGNQVYLLISSSTLRIYNSRTFNLIFEGPQINFDWIESINDKIYGISNEILMEIERGEIKKKFCINKENKIEEIKNELENGTHKNLSIPNFDTKIKQIFQLNNQIFILTSNGITNLENSFYFKINPNFIFPIQDSDNKILAIFDNKMELIDIFNQEKIFDYEIKNIKKIFNTPFLNTVGIVINNCNSDELIIFNLKNNEIIWNISSNEIINDTESIICNVRITNFSMTENYLMLNTTNLLDNSKSNNSIIWDVKRAMKINELKNSKNSEFISDNEFINVSNFIELYKMDLYSKILIHKRFLTGKIDKMERNNDKILFISKNNLINYNIYDDDQTTITKYDLDNLFMSGCLIGNESKLFYFKNKLNLINQSTNYEFTNLNYEEPFYIYGKDKIKMMNYQSNKIIKEINRESDISILNMGNIYGYKNKNIFKINENIELNGIEVKKMKSHGKFISVCDEMKVYLIQDMKIVREFNNECNKEDTKENNNDIVDYDISLDLKYLIVAKNNILILFNIITGKFIKSYKLKNKINQVLWSEKGDYLLVLFIDKTISTFYNNSLFNEEIIEYEEIKEEIDDDWENVCLETLAFMEHGKMIRNITK